MSRLSPQKQVEERFCVFSVYFIFFLVFLSPALHNTFHTPMARYSLFLLVSLGLNTNQQSKGSVIEPNILIYFFSRPSLNRVLFPMFCLLVEGSVRF